MEKCEYLLTWNFRHIANARIRRQAERLRGLYASRDAYAEEHGNDLDRIFADLTRRRNQ